MIWTKDELQKVLDRVPEEVHIGTGAETRTIKKRLPDEDACVTIGGGP